MNRPRSTRAAIGILGALVAVLSALPAHADPNRFAVIVGDNRGDRDEVVLRYAESDAERVATVLRTLGGFPPENVIVLLGQSASDVERVLGVVSSRAGKYEGQSLLFVFYSGHADADALHLGGSHLPTAALRDRVTGSAASTRVLVLDACRSGTMTRVKGGTPAPAFDVTLAYPLGAQGLALLSSSAAGESSQESDDLQASFFTHALVSALLGAADANHDDAVTLGEAFAYARERTLTATSRTVYGPQHPTFRYDLGGREDLVLTHPGAEYRNVGLLTFARRGFYVVHRRSADGPVVAELAADDDGGRKLALEAGRYFVTRREVDHLEQGRFDVLAHGVTSVLPQTMARLDYARVVRKGGTARRASGSLFVDGGVRGEVLGLGTAWRTEVGGRLDLSQASLELRLGFAGSERQNGRLDIDTRELSGAIAALRAFDIGPVTLDVGLELGMSWFDQALHDPSLGDRSSFGPFVGAVGQLEVPLSRRFYVRVEVAGLFYFLRTNDPIAGNTTATVGTYRGNAGLGLYFR
jgi:caspase domain-containing protein